MGKKYTLKQALEKLASLGVNVPDDKLLLGALNSDDKKGKPFGESRLSDDIQALVTREGSMEKAIRSLVLENYGLRHDRTKDQEFIAGLPEMEDGGAVLTKAQAELWNVVNETINSRKLDTPDKVKGLFTDYDELKKKGGQASRRETIDKAATFAEWNPELLANLLAADVQVIFKPVKQADKSFADEPFFAFTENGQAVEKHILDYEPLKRFHEQLSIIPDDEEGEEGNEGAQHRAASSTNGNATGVRWGGQQRGENGNRKTQPKGKSGGDEINEYFARTRPKTKKQANA